MGKASQAKKVAREARESGRVEARPKRKLAYPIVITLAVVLGILAVWYARRPADTPTANLVTPEVQTVDGSAAATSTSMVGGADAVPSTTAAP